MNKLNQALERLNDLIDGGWEFPDACAKVASENGVPNDDLRDAYDNQFN